MAQEADPETGAVRRTLDEAGDVCNHEAPAGLDTHHAALDPRGQIHLRPALLARLSAPLYIRTR